MIDVSAPKFVRPKEIEMQPYDSYFRALVDGVVAYVNNDLVPWLTKRSEAMGMVPVDPSETDRSHAAAHDARAKGKDPRTGRPVGDHGTASQAIDFAIDRATDEPINFLIGWRDGNLDEWPEFYTWLTEKDAG